MANGTRAAPASGVAAGAAHQENRQLAARRVQRRGISAVQRCLRRIIGNNVTPDEGPLGRTVTPLRLGAENLLQPALEFRQRPGEGEQSAAALRSARRASSFSMFSRRCSSKNGPPCAARYSPMRLFRSSTKSVIAAPSARAAQIVARFGRPAKAERAMRRPYTTFSPPLSRRNAMTSSTPSPLFMLAMTNGLPFRCALASRAITSSEAPT